MPGQVAAIALYTHFQLPPSAAVVSAVEEEVGSIAAPLGLDLEWKALDGGHPVESPAWWFYHFKAAAILAT
jgi:hypothetical protein